MDKMLLLGTDLCAEKNPKASTNYRLKICRNRDEF
jgi:hypothetical protein